MADIKLGYGCGIKATLLMPTGAVCDLRDALFVNAVLVLPNGSTMYAKDISADNVTNAIYVRLLADRELTTEGNYSILFNVKLVDGVMYSTVAVNFANVTTNADAEYKEIVLSSNLEVTDNPHNVQRTGASPKVSPRQTWLVYNDEAKAYEDTGIPAEVNFSDYYTKQETDAKVARLESEVNGNYITGKSVGRLGLEYDNVGWNCTDFIPYSGGDIEWTYGESTSNQQIALCTYDSDKNFIDKFLASDSSGKRTITSDKKELIGAAYIRASFNDSVINENVIVMDGYTFVLSKGIIYNVAKNEDDIKKINSKSNSYDNSILIYSEYVDNDGRFHQSPSGSIRSGFIAVSKGSVVSIQSVNSSDTNIVSFYSSESEESYIDGIANTTNNCTYNVPQDGYIVVCSSKANIDKFSMTYVEPRGISDRVALLEQSIPTKDVVILYKSEILTYSEYVDNDGVFHPSTAGSIRSGFIKVSKGDTVEVDSSNTEDTNKISLYSSQDESTYIVGVKNYKGKLIYDVPRNGYIVVCSSRSYNENFRLTHRTKLTINDRVTLLEDGVEVPNNAKPLNIPIFEPTNVTEAFTCDVGYDKAYINTDHQTFLSEYYDKYAFKTYDNYSVGKYTLGMDAAQDGHEIFCYEFAPKKHSKTVLLSSGMNCCELAPILGVAYFIKSLMEDYQNDEGLKWMRENVRFVVIPFICPSSFDVVPCRYTNANDVRINKNFNYRKSWFSMGNFAGLPGTKGDAPDSEIETKLLKQWISSYRGANLWIDCHADLSIDQPYKLIEVFYSDSNTGTKVKSTFNKIKQFYVDNGYISDPSSVVMNGSQEVNTFPKTLYSYNEIGIPALMIEQWALSVVYGSDPTKQCDSYAIKNYVTMLHQYIMACL